MPSLFQTAMINELLLAEGTILEDITEDIEVVPSAAGNTMPLYKLANN